jgi:hypothetical protein
VGIPVLAPRSVGNLGSSTTVIYTGLAAACTLLATGLSLLSGVGSAVPSGQRLTSAGAVT